MKNYTKILDEALNTPLEFYMTDDTKLPSNIVGAFTVDDTNYGMALEASGYDKIFMLRLYKISSGGKRIHWKIEPNHVVKCLSTLLKFTEAAMAFTKGKISGVIIRYSKKTKGAHRFSTLAHKMIKKTYIKSFSVVPVEDTGADQATGFVFFADKKKNPKQIFKSKFFTKKYDIKTGLSFEGADDIKSKVPNKSNATLIPSKKYSFGGLEMNTEHSNAAVQKVLNIPANTAFVDSSPSKSINAKKLSSLKKYKPEIVLGNYMGSMLNKIRQYGYDKNKFNFGDFEYTIGIEEKMHPSLRRYLLEVGLKTESGGYNKSNIENMLKKMSAAVKNPEKYEADMGEAKKAFDDQDDKLEKNNSTLSSAIVYTLPDIDPSELISEYPSNNPEYDSITGVFKQYTTDEHAVETEILSEYRAAFDNLDVGASAAITNYTNDSNPFNDTLREEAKTIATSYISTGGTLSKDSLAKTANNIRNHTQTSRLLSAFDLLPPSTKALWTHRGTSMSYGESSKIRPGYEFVDPGFVSTSIRKNLNFGSDIKLIIYNPVGTRYVPALGYMSKHSTEREIILMPLTLLKVIRVDKVPNSRYNCTCINMGSLLPSLLSHSDIVSEEHDLIRNYTMLFDEAKKKDTDAKAPQDYNPEDKYGPIDDKLSKTLIDALKNLKSK